MTTITESNISSRLDLSGVDLILPDSAASIVEYSSRDAFPSVGRTRRIYIALDTAMPWRWSEAASSYALLIPVIDAGSF